MISLADTSDHFPTSQTSVVSLMTAGLKTVAAGDVGGKPQPIVCRLTFPGASEDAVKEVLGGGALPSLELAVDLQPSTAPATLQLLWNDKPVPMQVLAGAAPASCQNADHASASNKQGGLEAFVS